MQKYLKITLEDFRKACEIHLSQACSLSCSFSSFGHFACFAKISHSHAKLLDVRFLLWFSVLHTWLIWKRLRSSPNLGFFICLSFNFLCHGLYKILPHSWFVLMIKKLSKTQKLAKNLLETLARVFNVPAELKGNKYYSKVFKRFYNKL